MRRALLFGLVMTLFALLTPGVGQANPWYGPWLMQNARTGKCIDLPGYGAGTIDGPVNQYTCRPYGDNQMWQLAYKPNEGSNAVVALYNTADNLCLDLPYYGSVAPGTRVTEYTCAGPEDNQYFVVVKRSGGGSIPEGYWFVHQKSRLCLDVDGFGTGGDDAPLTLWHCSDADDHIWNNRAPYYFRG
ncbi:RICIN domain-containing protein [Lentzea tibetensis]|uniref:RICIN domain-containing protein n=1 Tax=Lentzea tibetensis TaxID=2591470 RepID=A0A563ERD3_9PSEU|nr:RICIN domain-containing protein [Lentzea tibetensis]TWP50305.1 RICIN domain-containing protein [Lentzea tibetensis]